MKTSKFETVKVWAGSFRVANGQMKTDGQGLTKYQIVFLRERVG